MRFLQPRVLGAFLLFLYRNFMRSQGLETAKSLTYTSLFSVVPLITLMVTVLAAFPHFQTFGSRIENEVLQHLLPSTGRELESYLEEFALQARNLSWVGGVMLLVTAFLMLREVERCFNRVWEVPELRTGLMGFVMYWGVLSLGPVLLGLGFAINSYLGSLALFEKFMVISDVFGARSIMLALFPTLLTIGGFTWLYVAVPNCKVRKRHALVGAVVVVMVLKVVKWVFTLSIATASYQLIYGTFAALPIFLLWLYVCWSVILAGAHLVRGIPMFGARKPA